MFGRGGVSIALPCRTYVDCIRVLTIFTNCACRFFRLLVALLLQVVSTRLFGNDATAAGSARVAWPLCFGACQIDVVVVHAESPRTRKGGGVVRDGVDAGVVAVSSEGTFEDDEVVQALQARIHNYEEALQFKQQSPAQVVVGGDA